MHIKLNYFFELLKNRNQSGLCIVGKNEVLESLARMNGLESSDDLDCNNPYIKTLISSGASKGGCIDLDYDSSLYFAFADIAKLRIEQWHHAYFELNSGHFKDISIIENNASEPISMKVRSDYITEIDKKTSDSAVAFSIQFCSAWLEECVIKSALTHKKDFNADALRAELLDYSYQIVEKTINTNVNIKNGRHLSIAS